MFDDNRVLCNNPHVCLHDLSALETFCTKQSRRCFESKNIFQSGWALFLQLHIITRSLLVWDCRRDRPEETLGKSLTSKVRHTTTNKSTIASKNDYNVIYNQQNVLKYQSWKCYLLLSLLWQYCACVFVCFLKNKKSFKKWHKNCCLNFRIRIIIQTVMILCHEWVLSLNLIKIVLFFDYSYGQTNPWWR